MVKMISLVSQRYGTRMLTAGDPFDASANDARVLRALKRAKYEDQRPKLGVQEVSSVVVSPPEIEELPMVAEPFVVEDPEPEPAIVESSPTYSEEAQVASSDTVVMSSEDLPVGQGDDEPPVKRDFGYRPKKRDPRDRK
jgi:hypothetical protein